MINQEQQKVNKTATFWLVLSLHIGLGAGLYYYVQAPVQPIAPKAVHSTATAKPIVP
ncbi:MAG: hypothetical protein ACOYPR_21150 [Saprospiraceae bacterium]|jgi:hypothetical protein